MDPFKKNELTRKIVEAKAAAEHGGKGAKDDVDYLESIKNLAQRHPEVMEPGEVRDRAIARDDELRNNGVSYYPDRMDQIADELDGVADPVVDALGDAIERLDVDKAEAIVRLVRTGRLVPEQAAEEYGPEDGPDDQTAIGIMQSLRAPTQVRLAELRKMKESLK